MKHTLTIAGWQPTRLNVLIHSHWRAAQKLKDFDTSVIMVEARSQRIPKAEGRRRVSLLITLAPRQRAGDVDAFWKSTLDALKRAGLIIDDNRQWCELAPVEFARGGAKATTITLEDLP